MLWFNTKIGKEKENSYQKMKIFPDDTHKHTEASQKRLDSHRGLSQPEESKCMWTHSKDSTMWKFWISATRVGAR